VSIIVPVKNGAATLAGCIEALLAQDYPRALTEIVIVDSGSTDDTPRVAARYPVTLLTECDIRTSYAARNRGIAQAGGEVIALTDADCTPAPDWLRRLVGPLADANTGAALGAIEDAPAASLCEELMVHVRPFARPERSGQISGLERLTADARDCWIRGPIQGNVQAGTAHSAKSKTQQGYDDDHDDQHDLTTLRGLGRGQDEHHPRHRQQRYPRGEYQEEVVELLQTNVHVVVTTDSRAAGDGATSCRSRPSRRL
jgi:glycosyltransferase involved in cell wall biosynthesis